MRGLYQHSREYRKCFLRDHFPHSSQILEGIHVSANICRVCIRTRPQTGQKFPANRLCIGFAPGGTLRGPTPGATRIFQIVLGLLNKTFALASILRGHEAPFQRCVLKRVSRALTLVAPCFAMCDSIYHPNRNDGKSSRVGRGGLFMDTPFVDTPFGPTQPNESPCLGLMNFFAQLPQNC